jgi:hypothetical protein
MSPNISPFLNLAGETRGRGMNGWMAVTSLFSPELSDSYRLSFRGDAIVTNVVMD